LLCPSRRSGALRPRPPFPTRRSSDLTDNPLLYSLRGLLGGFPGRYQLVPYFLKVQEYNNAESRDLWTYELDFSPEQIRSLLLALDRKSTRLNSSHVKISYAVFCLKKK